MILKNPITNAILEIVNPKKTINFNGLSLKLVTPSHAYLIKLLKVCLALSPISTLYIKLTLLSDKLSTITSTLEKKYPVGSEIEGKIVSINEYAIYLNIKDYFLNLI